MNKHETLSLMDGHFTADEAREVLISIFQAKIHFHVMRNFSSQERFGCHDKVAMERLPILKKGLERIQELVSRSSEINERLIVTAQVRIQFEEVGE